MKSRNLKSAVWLILAVSATALAAGGPPPGKGGGGGDGGGGGGGGGGGEETATNNLSVPMIILGGGSFTGVTCGPNVFSALVPPTGAPKDGYEVNSAAFYFVQGINKWQAPCSNSSVAVVDVNGKWGDNLTGDAKLKVGSPIRVELVLSEASGMTSEGYTVVKLEPAKLDRESAYGTLATGAAPNWVATPALMTPLVFDAKATMEITKSDGTVVALENPAGAEINATGKVVYGYNLRVTAAGPYLIKFTVPGVNFIGGCGKGTCAGNTATLPITVIAGGGGGGGGGKPIKPGK